MFRKIIAVILTAAVVLPMCSCSTVKRSGKPYINRSDDFVVDGFNYRTEEKQTDNFIAYRCKDGRVLLYPVSAEKALACDPDGLCDVEPGGMYKIKYDVQYVTGGFAGIMKAYFLAVYSCTKIDCDTLFENGCLMPVGGWSVNFPIAPRVDGLDYMAFENEEGGYDLYSETCGKRHYDEMREIKFPLEFENDDPVEMEFNVFCNKDLTDEYIKDCLLNRKTDEGFILFNADHPGDTAEGMNYDSIEKASVGFIYWHNIICIESDEPVTEETRRLITYEEMRDKTADELGLPQDVYDQFYPAWESRVNGSFSYYGTDNEPVAKYDVLLFGGDFGQNVDMKYDSDLKLQPYDWYDYENTSAQRYPYAALFIRSEFNDLLPQD